MTVSSTPKAIGGSTELFTVLKLLADPTTFQERIMALASAEASATQALSAVGLAEDIPKIRAEAERLLEEAKVTLLGANNDAVTIVDKAKAEAGAHLSDVRSVMAEHLADAKKKLESAAARNEETIALQKVVEERDAALNAKTLELHTTAAELETQRASLADQQSALAAERSKLQKLRADLTAQLEE